MTESELLIYAKSFKSGVLRGTASHGMCAAISASLGAALNILGVSAKVVASSLEACDHIYLQLNEGRVLDPTLDQFNSKRRSIFYPEIYIGEPIHLHQNSFDWEGADIWTAFMVQLRRLYPAFDAYEVGTQVGNVLRTMPSEFIKFDS